MSPAGAARGAPGPGPAAAADVREPLSAGPLPPRAAIKALCTLQPRPSVCLSVCWGWGRALVLLLVTLTLVTSLRGLLVPSLVALLVVT